MKPICALVLFLAIVFSACNSDSTHRQKTSIPVDSTISFKIDNYWVTPKRSFEFNSVGNSSKDTLDLVTCSDYVYFPFGKLTDKSSLPTSLLKDFTITHFTRDTFTDTNISPSFLEWSESLDLQLGDNKLKLFLDNDPEATTHGYIRGGQIVNNKVSFLNGIKIGMNTSDFYRVFFDDFPVDLNKKYTVVKLESCVEDVIHIYTFNSGQLFSVKFIFQ